MTIQHDLFGGASLVREWGRVGSAGQVAQDLFPDEGTAIDALAKVAKRKLSRGYRA